MGHYTQYIHITFTIKIKKYYKENTIQNIGSVLEKSCPMLNTDRLVGHTVLPAKDVWSVVAWILGHSTDKHKNCKFFWQPD